MSFSFIALTTKDGTNCLVGVAHITCIMPEGSGSKIFFPKAGEEQDYIVVKEPLTEVVKLLGNADA